MAAEQVVITGQIFPYAATTASSGTKTDTPLIETPLSIQVIPQQVLEDQKITSLDRALNNISGISSGGGEGGQESIYLRGFFTTTTFRDGFRVDEYSPTGGGTIGSVSLANVESIEVLKGPAAILYGLVEPGGIVNIITKQPKDYYFASLEQVVGSWGHYLTNLDVTGPIDDGKRILFRLNASYDQTSSWRDGVYGRTSFVAPVLEWRITPDTTISLQGEFRREHLNQDVGQIVPFDTIQNVLIWPPRTKQLLSNPTTFNTNSVDFRATHRFNSDWSVALHLTDNEVTVPTAPDYYPAQMYQAGGTWLVDRGLNTLGSTNKTKAAILDLTGHFETLGIKHTLLFGGDFYHSNFSFDFGGSDYGIFSTTDVFNPTPPSGLVPDPVNEFRLYQMNESFGVHLQDQIQLGQSLFVLVGLRYQHFRTTSAFEAPVGTSPVPGTPAEDEATTPRLGVLWRPLDWFSLYSNYAENFGVNNGFDYQEHALPPEKARQYEVGGKTQFYEGKLTASLALYDLTKFNVAVADLVHPNFQQTIGEVRSRGVEFDIQGELVHGWNIIANATYNYAYVAKSTAGSSYVEGNRLDNDPLYMVNLWTTYQFDSEALRGLRIGGGVTFHGSSVNTRGNIPALVMPAYSDWSAMAAYQFRIGGQTAQVQINITNLFDAKYYNDIYPVASSNYAFVNYSTPRQVTASLKAEF